MEAPRKLTTNATKYEATVVAALQLVRSDLASGHEEKANFVRIFMRFSKIRAVFDGLRAAYARSAGNIDQGGGNGKNVDEYIVLRLISLILAGEEGNNIIVYGVEFDDDNNYAAYRRAMMDVVSAYLSFDREGKGYFTSEEYRGFMASSKRAEAPESFFTEERWSEIDLDGDGKVGFGEFVSAFSRWVSDGEDDNDDDDGEKDEDNWTKNPLATKITLARSGPVAMERGHHQIKSILITKSMSSSTANPTSTSRCQPDEEATFTCPICLFEKPAVYTSTKLGDDDGDVNNIDHEGRRVADGAPCQIFQLSSCNHKFCTVCLRAYVRSKLFDGVVDIPCCHFKLSSDEEEDFHPCNVLLIESDIDQLLHTVVDDDEHVSNARPELFCTTDDPCYDIFASKNACKENNNDEIADQLWIKYQKLKFDLHHGRDTVRRCPSCDEAHLFDEGAMKQYQSTFLTQQHAIPIPAVPAPNRSTISTGNIMLRGFQRRQRDAQDVPSRDEERNDENKSVVTADPRTNVIFKEDDLPKPSSDDVAVPTTVASVESESPLDHNHAELPQDENPALVKSKTPVVTCQECCTEFCYFHSNAHSGTDSTSRMSCIEYHKKSLELDRANVDFASRILRAKPCPTCGISVSKEGGCNQIKCGSCGTHFCWLCGAIVDGGALDHDSEHFGWWNPRGCANYLKQLDESSDPLRCTIWGAKLMSGFQIIVLGIPSAVLTLVSMALCPCFVLCCGSTNRERGFNCINFWGSLLMLPFTCLGMIISLALSCFVAALSSLSKFLIPNNSGSHSENAAASRQSNTNDSDDLTREIGSILDRMEEGGAYLGD